MPYGLVVAGASLGGLAALRTLLRGLPGEFPLPLVVVQHRQANSDEALAALLQQDSRLPVREAQDKERILPGQAFLAPADYHLLVEEDHLALSTDGPVLHARPSIDVLFESAALAYRHELVAVVLTGTGCDGAQGAARVKERGGLVVVQDPATAESPSMPRAAIAAAGADRVLPLVEIASFLAGLNRLAER